MSASLIVTDCPECKARGTVVLGTHGVCMACFAEFDDEDETISHGGTEPTHFSRLSRFGVSRRG